MVKWRQPPPVIRPVISREANDCAICALATYLGVSYEDVLRVVTRVDAKEAGREGLFSAQMRNVAKALGFRVRWRRFVDLDDAFGILYVLDHALVVWNGMAIDCDGSIWHIDDYLQVKDLAPLGLLEIDTAA